MKTITHKILRYATHPLAKGSMIVLVGSMGANVWAYIYHVVIGRLLGPVIYGEFSALMSLFYLINIGSSVVQTILTKFFSQLRARKSFPEIPTLFWVSFRFIGFVSLAGLALISLFSKTLGSFLHISSMHFVWLYFIFVAYMFSVINISLIQAFQLFLASSILTNLGAMLRIVFGVLGAPFGLLGVLIGNITSNVLTYIIYFVPIWRLIRVKAQPLSLTKSDTLSYSIPALLATLGTIALYSQDVLLVKHFFPAHEAGIYASLAVLGKVIFYASAALSYVMFPMVVERNELKQSHRAMVVGALGGVAAVSLALTLGYFLFPFSVVRFMYGNAFDGAAPYMGLFGLFITFFSLVNLLTTIFLALGKTYIWVITIGTAVAQGIGLWLFHASLFDVVLVNIVVTLIACMILLIYYFHAKE